MLLSYVYIAMSGLLTGAQSYTKSPRALIKTSLNPGASCSVKLSNIQKSSRILDPFSYRQIGKHTAVSLCKCQISSLPFYKEFARPFIFVGQVSRRAVFFVINLAKWRRCNQFMVLPFLECCFRAKFSLNSSSVRTIYDYRMSTQ